MTSRFARIDERASRSSWLVWAIAVGVYFLALLHRASLGVAGPDAVARLGISATELGAFIMVQLGLYAFMQVPAGLAIDRWGPRRVLLVATLVMGSAQLLFAVATSYPVALAARALLGVGDAAVFIGVLRIAAMWFPHRRYAVLTMATSLVGMAGNLVATVPLVIALDGLGWTRTFAITAIASIAYALLLLRPAVAAPFREATGAPAAGSPRKPSFREAMANVPASWRRPETRLGFWTHQATMTIGVVVSLVWGYPYLTQALGFSNAAAASQLSLYGLATVFFSLFIGPLAGRHPSWRTAMALLVASTCAVAVVTLALWPGGRPPGAVVTTVFIVLGTGGPASQIGFHLARDYNPASRISTATGLVNAGGFLGAMVMAIAVGAVLDISSAGSVATLADYRWALGTMAALAAASTAAMLGSTLRVRADVLDRIARGESVVVRATERWWDRAYRRLARRPAPRSAGDPESDGRGQDAEHERPDGVPHRRPAAIGTDEADGIETRRAERGVPTEQPGAQDLGELAAAEPADNQTHREGPGDVDEGHAQGAGEPGTDGAVDHEPQHGPQAPGERDEGDHRATR